MNNNGHLRRDSGDGGYQSGSNKVNREWSANDILEKIRKDGLLEPGGHHMLVYGALNSLRRVYSEYAAVALSENEIFLMATQYETIESVRNNLAARRVDVKKHLLDGTLFIVDAQQGYFAGDIDGTLKLALTLASRTTAEDRHGFTWFGDMGSFFAFDKIAEMMDYELWRCPRKYEDVMMMKTVCCYHTADFGTLATRQREALFDHHYESFVIN